MHTNTVPRLAPDPPGPFSGSSPAALCRLLLGALAMVVVGLADGAWAADWVRPGINIDQPVWGLREGLQLPASPTLPFGLRCAQAMAFPSVAGVADAVAALSERPLSGCVPRRL